MIRYWLHEKPSLNISKWQQQVAQASYIEQRMFEALGKIIHGKK